MEEDDNESSINSSMEEDTIRTPDGEGKKTTRNHQCKAILHEHRTEDRKRRHYTGPKGIRNRHRIKTPTQNQQEIPCASAPDSFFTT